MEPTRQNVGSENHNDHQQHRRQRLSVFLVGAPAGLIGIISPWQNRQDLFVWKDDFSKVSGKHTFKAGFLYSRNAKDEEVGDEGGEFWGEAPTGSPAARYTAGESHAQPVTIMRTTL